MAPESRWSLAAGGRSTADHRLQTNYLDDIVLIKFPSAVKNLHFDLIDGMQILGVEEPGNYAETVTLTNIPRYITEIWFDFEYLDTVKGNDFVTLRLLVFKNFIFA